MQKCPNTVSYNGECGDALPPPWRIVGLIIEGGKGAGNWFYGPLINIGNYKGVVRPSPTGLLGGPLPPTPYPLPPTIIGEGARLFARARLSPIETMGADP